MYDGAIQMNLYIIRHATTKANLGGEMVDDYAHQHILPFNADKWHNKVGKYLPKNFQIISSPAERCLETTKALFNREPDLITDNLAEFDCKDIGQHKFWEMTKEEFEWYVKIKPQDMSMQISKFLTQIYTNDINLSTIEPGGNNYVIVTHGMVARYMYHWFNKNESISAYDVINSNGFKFANLDMFTYKQPTGDINVYRFKEPINHR